MVVEQAAKCPESEGWPSMPALQGTMGGLPSDFGGGPQARRVGAWLGELTAGLACWWCCPWEVAGRMHLPERTVPILTALRATGRHGVALVGIGESGGLPPIPGKQRQL